MDNQDSQKVIEALHKKLESTIKDSFKNLRSYTNIESKVKDDVSEKMFGFISGSNFQANVLSNIKLRDTKIDVGGFSGMIEGIIYLDYMKDKDFSNYGEVGYEGQYDEQIVNTFGDTYYQWNEFTNKWTDVSSSICGTDDYGNSEQSWGGKLTANAAFEPWWGTNTNGGDIISDRHSNGADDLWGDPGIRSPMGIMKGTGYLSDLAKNMFKIVFKFSLDIESAVSHYLKLEKALKKSKTNTQEQVKRAIDSITREKQMVIIRIHKQKEVSYFMKDGFVNKSGNGVLKDTSAFASDTTGIRKKVFLENVKVDREAYAKFKRGY